MKNQVVEMIDVVSSTVDRIGYDGQDLYVAYKGGRTYCYKNVPRDVYDMALTAPSVGKFLNSQVKIHYDYVEVTAQAPDDDDDIIECPVKLVGTLERSTPGSAGYDLRATEDIFIPAGGRALIKTGVRVAMPVPCCAFVTPRSGLAYKHGLTVLNGPGLIDPDYRGDIGVILHNTNDVPYTVLKGEKIAQLVFLPYLTPQFIPVQALDETETQRGSNGFGSTGRQ